MTLVREGGSLVDAGDSTKGGGHASAQSARRNVDAPPHDAPPRLRVAVGSPVAPYGGSEERCSSGSGVARDSTRPALILTPLTALANPHKN